MDLRKLKTLIDLVSDSNISELEITEAEGKVRIVKTVPQAAAVGTMMVAPGPAPAIAAAPVAAAEAPAPAVPVETGQIIKSPMVGTFYRTATPGAKPFVEIGQQVKEGDAVCIIEAMKIMNEIDTEYAGTITKVLVENGQAVEFGQPLFVVE